MTALILGAAALLPAFLLVVYFHRRDIYREPPRVLWTTFALGIVIVVPVVLVAWPLDKLASMVSNPLAYGFATAFLGAAIPEEVFKFLVVQGYAARHIECDEPMDGMVYGATASLGFAALENVLYVAQGGMHVAIMRAFLSVPGHAFLGAIMGYFVGQAKFSGKPRGPLLTKALLIPILLHGFYNAPLLATARLGDDPLANPWGWVVMALIPLAPAIVLFEAIWSLRLLHRLRADQLAGKGPYVLPEAAPHPRQVTLPPPLPHRHPPVPPSVPQPAPSAASPSGLGRLLGWLATLGGGALFLGGGLVTVVVLAALLFDSMTADERLFTGVGGLLLGPLPLFAGGMLFLAGIHQLNKSSPPRQTF